MPAAALLVQAADLWLQTPHLLAADFRREYGIARSDLARLPAVEWAQLTMGLSPEARTVAWVGEQKRKRKAKPPSSPDEYLRSVSKLRGKVNVAKADASKGASS